MQQFISVPVSIGELLDKITILEIKKSKITEEKKLKNICSELNALINVCETAKISLQTTTLNDLRKINAELWKIEDDIREKERRKEFDQDFIALARAVYRQNDERFRAKSTLNAEHGSAFHEEKSYKPY